MGQYVVLEKFPEPYLVVEEDTGKAKVFYTNAAAKKEAENCQDGQVIPLTLRIHNLNRKGKY